jgi:osmotically inducible protein OsmC
VAAYVYACRLMHHLSILVQGFEIEIIESKCDIDLVDGAIVTSHLTISAKK